MKLQRAILLVTSATIVIIDMSASNIVIGVRSSDMSTSDMNGRHTINKK